MGVVERRPAAGSAGRAGRLVLDVDRGALPAPRCPGRPIDRPAEADLENNPVGPGFGPLDQRRLGAVSGVVGAEDDDDGVQKDSAADVRAKLGRARAHLAELEKDTQAYLASDPFEVYADAEPDRGPITYRVHVRAEPPEHLGLLLGDALHNARTALDHVVCRLVEDGGGTVTQDTMFPTNRKSSDWPKTVKKKLAGASAAARAAVMATNAYPGGDNQLWALHQLDISDKHKVLIPVAMHLGAVNMRVGHAVFGDEAPLLPICPADVIRIVEGVAIFSIAEQPRFAEQRPPALQSDYSFRFDLGLDSNGLLGPRPVHLVPTATALIDHAEAVALDLAKYLT